MDYFGKISAKLLKVIISIFKDKTKRDCLEKLVQERNTIRTSKICPVAEFQTNTILQHVGKEID